MNARTEPANLYAEAETQVLRLPPHSVESETSVLGAILLDNRAWDQVCDLLTEADFYRFEHRTVFTAIGQLINASRAADVVTVFAHLQKSGKADEAGGLVYLNSLAQYVPSAANIRRYADTVRECSIRRRLISASDQIATEAFNPKGRAIADILDDSMRKVMDISPDVEEEDWTSMQTLVVRELDAIQARSDNPGGERGQDFLPTGIKGLDDIFDGGLRGGQLVVIAARPSMGKSALALEIGQHVGLNLGLPVAVFSMEMQNEEGGQRALASTAKIPMHALRRPERMSALDWQALTPGVEKLSLAKIYWNDKPGLNINQVRAKARALKRKHGLALAVVDYLQLMAGTDPRLPRTYQLEEASRGLKSLAKELGIPVIALAQVNRGVEKEVDPMPRMSDIKDCGSIEQDADIIVMMDRPIVRKPDLAEEWKHYAKARVVKQRGGRIGDLHLQFVGSQMRYSDWPEGLEIPTNLAITKRGSL